MAKRVIIAKGADTQEIWECDLDTMISYGWKAIAEIHDDDEIEQEIEDGDL
jgi:hypothetical protein